MKKLDIFHLIYNEIIKYLDYADYLNFNSLLNKNEIIIHSRKCIFCNKIPYFPTSINYSLKTGFIYNNVYNKDITKCSQSLVNPCCLFCLINIWMNKFNKKSRKIRKINGFSCPYGCCHVESNTLGTYLLNFNNIGNSHLTKMRKMKINLNRNFYCKEAKKFHTENIWKNLYDKEAIKCNFCNKLFNKYEYLISHYKNDFCKKVKCKYYGYTSDSSDSSDSEQEEISSDYIEINNYFIN